ncbi:hypothetical protein I3843_07G198800 [Carya illinoinensis]|uniref:Uncharacterized protein n=1 Tax=Carya illinoinensis TaxID=32201 RepID=A0A922ENT8_CARIL|nr:hypothetical protein I3842_07G205300 [Carya illinoinensis]KAG7972753.1 hypothetical protein I3843_07G198800 [Carya illinoinensis]
MAAPAQPKWVENLTAELVIPTAEEAWPFLEDYCNLHKFAPDVIDTSHHVEGICNQPGLVRYCAATATRVWDGRLQPKQLWVHEKLIKIDPIKKSLSYEVTENNVGIKTLVGTCSAYPISKESKQGCKLQWSFVADPIPGWEQAEFASFIQAMLTSMAKNIEDTITAKKKKTEDSKTLSSVAKSIEDILTAEKKKTEDPQTLSFIQAMLSSITKNIEDILTAEKKKTEGLKAEDPQPAPVY